MSVTQSCLVFVTPWTVAHKAPPPMGFSRQEYRSGLPFPSPGDLPNPGINPRYLALRADSLPSEPPGKSKGNYGSYFILCMSKATDFSMTSESHVYRAKHDNLSNECFLITKIDLRFM